MNKKIFVGNLPFTAQENDLMAIFASDGRQVTSIKLLIDQATGRSRGFAFVEMSSEDDAQKAFDALNGKDFMGRPLNLSEAREGPQRGPGAPYVPAGPRVGLTPSGGPVIGPRPNGSPGAPPPRPFDRDSRPPREGRPYSPRGAPEPASTEIPADDQSNKRNRRFDQKNKERDQRRSGRF